MDPLWIFWQLIQIIHGAADAGQKIMNKTMHQLPYMKRGRCDFCRKPKLDCRLVLAIKDPNPFSLRACAECRHCRALSEIGE